MLHQPAAAAEGGSGAAAYAQQASIELSDKAADSIAGFYVEGWHAKPKPAGRRLVGDAGIEPATPPV